MIGAVRVWQSNCKVDTHAVQSINHAYLAGMTRVDIYVFPSYTCALSGADQVRHTVAAMGDTKFNVLWLDIEMMGSNWSKDYAKNRAWLSDAIDAAKTLLGAPRVGIYSSAAGWQIAMGTQAGFPDIQLWFAQYDAVPQVSDFRPFAGWKSAVAKQFLGNVQVCGITVDVNAYAP